jgi:DNA (cytosine-5)-methyltransferase 1
MTEDVIYATDLFCGAGGTSTGLAQACRNLGRGVELVAINHWREAVETHTVNHPWAKHLCMNVEAVDPRTAVPGGHLHILVASPECTHFSRAAGGRPKNDQRRSSAWQTLRWIELVDVDSMLIENVPEFRNWGPLDEQGIPVKGRQGEIYQSFISSLRAFGYNVDAKVLNAADYGAPTSRSRLFIQARKGSKAVNWPTPTHSKRGRGAKRWRAAKEIIDWGLHGESIFTRKKPLSPRTYARIIEGLKRFGGPELRPFIVMMEHQGGVRDVEEPLPTITTAKGGAMALVEPVGQPFILSQGSNGAPKGVDDDPVPAIMTGGKHALVETGFILSQASGGAPRSVDDPMPTIPGKGAHALIVPMFGERKGQKLRVKSVEETLDSVTSHGAGALAEATIIEYHAGKNRPNRVDSVDAPLKTIDTSNRYGIAMPFILPVEGYFQDGRSHNPPRSVEEPLGTITQRGYGGVVEPFLVQLQGTDKAHISVSAKSVEDPLPSQQTSNHSGIVEPFLTQYNGTSGPQSVDKPLPTISTHDRFGLVQPMINGRVLDIRFRMLQPSELAAAMGFPKEYQWKGTKTDAVKMIGNAVSVDIARALCTSLLTKPKGRLSDVEKES